MTKKTRDLKDFCAQFDRKEQTRTRLRNALADLRKQGPEEWLESRAFLSAAKVGCNVIPDYYEEFAAHIVRVPSLNRGTSKTIWFGCPKAAAKARASVTRAL
jgi:hypothetical protein